MPRQADRNKIPPDQIWLADHRLLQLIVDSRHACELTACGACSAATFTLLGDDEDEGEDLRLQTRRGAGTTAAVGGSDAKPG